MAHRSHYCDAAWAVLGGLGTLLACSVDTSSITFQDDDVFYGQGEGGSSNNGGKSTSGGNKVAGSSMGAETGNGGSSSSGGKSTSGGQPLGGNTSGGAGGAPPGGAPPGGMGGMPPEMCPVVRGDPMEVLIDDFEDGDAGLPNLGGRIGGWYVANDGTGTQLPLGGEDAPPIVPESPGFMSNYALHTSGSNFRTWGAVVGLGLLSPFPPPHPACPYDLSRYSGIRFALRGEVSDMIVRVQIPTVATHQPPQGGTCMPAEGDCGDHHGVDLMIVDTWSTHAIDFADMTQGGWGLSFPFDPRRAMNIEFRLYPNTTFDVWIDSVEFY